MINEKAPYLPKVRTDYEPSEDEIKSVSVDKSTSIALSNPAVDDIAVNNIACAEFDYTEDMMSSTNSNNNSLEKAYIKQCNKK